MATLTVKATIAAVRLTGATCRRIVETGEYRVNLPTDMGGTEDTAHYASDAEDAIGTALAMMEPHQRNMPSFCLKSDPKGIAALAPFARNTFTTVTNGHVSSHQPVTADTLVAMLGTLKPNDWPEATVTKHGSLYVRVRHSFTNGHGHRFTYSPFAA